MKPDMPNSHLFVVPQSLSCKHTDVSHGICWQCVREDEAMRMPVHRTVQ
jgi:hypothetical protein